MQSKKSSNNKERASFAGCPFFCWIILAVTVFLSACAGKSGGAAVVADASRDSLMQLRYAHGFEVAYRSDCKLVTVFDAWQHERVAMQRYYLYDIASDSVLPVHDDGVSLRVPLRSVALGSCTQIEFVSELASLETVKGMCSGHLVYNNYLRERVGSGSVADLGDAFNLDVERVLSLGVDAFFASSYGKTDPKLDILSRSGLPIVYDNEWMETDLLGRAEWIRFVACFFDMEEEADSLFSATVRQYMALKQLAANDSLATPLSVLSGENFRGTWYLPGGRSYTAQLFRDSGAGYLYDQDTTAGSLSFSVEQVLRDFHSADVWVGVSAADLQELSAKDSHYKVFDAWKNGTVYAYDFRSTGSGGNDYWESAVAHPDALLSDFVKLCHPAMMDSVGWNYLRKLPVCAVR